MQIVPWSFLVFVQHGYMNLSERRRRGGHQRRQSSVYVDDY
jgi:hypothetical protein